MSTTEDPSQTVNKWDPNELIEPVGGFIDGRNPDLHSHLCIVDLNIHDGPVEDCCLSKWRSEGVGP